MIRSKLVEIWPRAASRKRDRPPPPTPPPRRAPEASCTSPLVPVVEEAIPAFDQSVTDGAQDVRLAGAGVGPMAISVAAAVQPSPAARARRGARGRVGNAL